MPRASWVPRWFRSILVALLAAFALMACGGGPSGGPGGLTPDLPSDAPTDTPVDDPADTPGDTTPDAPSSGVLSIVVEPAAVTLRVGEQAVLVATLEAADGVDVSVVWSTDAAGVATVDAAGAVQGHGIGSATVTVRSVADPDMAASATVTVLDASAPEPASVRFVGGEVGAAIVGTDIAEAPRVEVLDADGLPVPGRSVRFEVVAGGGSIEPTAPVITDAEGFAALNRWQLGTIAGAQRLRASLDGTEPPLTAELDVDALPGPASPLTSTVVADPTTLPADAASTSSLSVTLFDAYDNPIVLHDSTVSFDAPAAGTIGPVSAMPDGTVVATFTAPTVPATVEVSARVDGVAIAATVTIDVVETPAVTAVSIDGGDRTLSPGDVVALSATVMATGGASEAVHWSSDDDAVVSVSEDGILTAVGPGTTEVVAQSVAEPSVEGRISVTVVDSVLPSPVPWTYGLVTTGSFLVSGSSLIETHVWAGGEVDVRGASSIADGVDVWAGESCRVGSLTCLEGVEPPLLEPVDWDAVRDAVVDHYLGGAETESCDVTYVGAHTAADLADTVVCLEPGASLVVTGSVTGALVLGERSTSVVVHAAVNPSATHGRLGIAVVAGDVEVVHGTSFAGVVTIVAAGDLVVSGAPDVGAGPVETVFVTESDVHVLSSPAHAAAVIRANGRVTANGGAGSGAFSGAILAGDGGIEFNASWSFVSAEYGHFLVDLW